MLTDAMTTGLQSAITWLAKWVGDWVRKSSNRFQRQIESRFCRGSVEFADWNNPSPQRRNRVLRTDRRRSRVQTSRKCPEICSGWTSNNVATFVTPSCKRFCVNISGSNFFELRIKFGCAIFRYIAFNTCWVLQSLFRIPFLFFFFSFLPNTFINYATK